jgi:hypothetical protein
VKAADWVGEQEGVDWVEAGWVVEEKAAAWVVEEKAAAWVVAAKAMKMLQTCRCRPSKHRCKRRNHSCTAHTASTEDKPHSWHSWGRNPAIRSMACNFHRGQCKPPSGHSCRIPCRRCKSAQGHKRDDASATDQVLSAECERMRTRRGQGHTASMASSQLIPVT